MNRASFLFWQVIFSSVYKYAYKVDFRGKEKFPLTGPVIVAPNHLSNNDPPIIGFALPRHVSFMAKEELFKNPIFAAVIKWLGAFPVHRGGVDKIAIRRAREILKENKVLGIFPEGSRQKEGHLGRFHDGVASMALRTGTPIVPVAVIGTDKMVRGQIACIVGDSILVEKAKPTIENMQAVNEELRNRLQQLIDDYKREKHIN